VPNRRTNDITGIKKLDKTSRFFLPKKESASDDRAKDPIKQPKKNVDCGRD
jgi:hypothetical protein